MDMGSASIAVVATHGIEALRSTLARIRETAAGPCELVVLADQHDERAVTYLARHYLRGDVAAIGLEASGDGIGHCGLDHAFHLSSGDVLVRLSDDLELADGWLDAVLETLAEHDEIGVLGLLEAPGRCRRGRPPKRRRPPEEVEAADVRAFATRRSLFGEHEAALEGRPCVTGCLFQDRVRAAGLQVACLPGQVKPARGPLAARAPVLDLGLDPPVHDGPGGAMGHLRQVYQLGEEVLVPCMACGDNEFEVLAAQIEFCERHGVPVGYTYTLRCTTCNETLHQEDFQFRCPG